MLREHKEDMNSSASSPLLCPYVIRIYIFPQTTEDLSTVRALKTPR